VPPWALGAALMPLRNLQPMRSLDQDTPHTKGGQTLLHVLRFPPVGTCHCSSHRRSSRWLKVPSVYTLLCILV
jgi:hypothetical protein